MDDFALPSRFFFLNCTHLDQLYFILTVTALHWLPLASGGGYSGDLAQRSVRVIVLSYVIWLFGRYPKYNRIHFYHFIRGCCFGFGKGNVFNWDVFQGEVASDERIPTPKTVWSASRLIFKSIADSFIVWIRFAFIFQGQHTECTCVPLPNPSHVEQRPKRSMIGKDSWHDKQSKRRLPQRRMWSGSMQQQSSAAQDFSFARRSAERTCTQPFHGEW